MVLGTRKLITITPQMGVREAYFLMRDEDIRHLPVVEEDQLVGIISDRQLRRPNWADEAPDIEHPYLLSDDLTVGDVMEKDVVTCRTYETLSKANKTIMNHNVGALPVLDKTDALVGILSAVDLLAALQDLLKYQKSKKKVRA
ncbi:CBS domain-containing protein [Enterovibrio nigricans]|uniref:Acetoin utilization protein AcuB n=1 Tax=Enterovibrio nigricans DSM 22720 TaxID=1121868 RepID=A0A1T4U5F7_9GAMM|nr:CBS domain-containing protein [Enterovibrio nigricans]PKF51341.1 CBS domain-containing protein [Enterovibrio nigricans]SKA48012.1 acetoin utilization protein AcuB [Enterovibrio nigricans DSM 22720]